MVNDARSQAANAMLLPHHGRRICNDLTGPEDAPVVCMTHSRRWRNSGYFSA